MANLTRTASNDNLAGKARTAIAMNDQDRVVSDGLSKELTGGLGNVSGHQRFDAPDGAVTQASLRNIGNTSASDLPVPREA